MSAEGSCTWRFKGTEEQKLRELYCLLRESLSDWTHSSYSLSLSLDFDGKASSATSSVVFATEDDRGYYFAGHYLHGIVHEQDFTLSIGLLCKKIATLFNCSVDIKCCYDMPMDSNAEDFSQEHYLFDTFGRQVVGTIDPPPCAAEKR